MRFTVSAAALLAFAAKVLAQSADFDPILTPGEGETLDAGSKYTITWEVVDKYNGTASIVLLGGKTENTLEILDTIASGVDNGAGSYDWSIASDLGSDPTYGLKIQWDADESIFQYSFPFAIKGNGGSSSSSASGSATGTQTSASATETSGSTTTGSASSETITSTVSSVSSIVSPTGNLSTTGSPATTVTSVVVPTGSGTSSSPSSTASTIPSSGAAKLAGSFIALTGLAAAALLL